MAVAVKNASEEGVPQSPSMFDRLAIGSVVGALYVLGSIGIVFHGIPQLWDAMVGGAISNSFVNVALLLVVMAAAAVGLGVLGVRLVGPNPPKGIRAGVFSAAVGLLLIAFATWIVGNLLETYLFKDEGTRMLGILVTLAVGVGFLVLASRYFFKPSFEEALLAFEEQGWFNATMYKRSQGQRVRRGTILGVLILAVCGIYTLLAHRSLDAVGYETINEAGKKFFYNDWFLWVPFTDGQRFVLLKDVKLTVPLLLLAGSLWLAFRIVNLPVFADFLIATEAEMNKVSWTTRKRLIQDTIVVLTTVILLTVFLFVVDILWGFLLTQVGVLRSDPNAGQQSITEKEQPW
ncbi:MAG: preprotein translocase subunit SecE [Gemmataceae bacterium]|nr:preprotein translocase subunit SecE [Gemmataceae bacterium]